MLEKSISSDLKLKSKSIDIDSNVNLVVNEEDKGENFTVMKGKLNPKQEEQEQAGTITAEAKLGFMKIEQNNWFSSLKLK